MAGLDVYKKPRTFREVENNGRWDLDADLVRVGDLGLGQGKYAQV